MNYRYVCMNCGSADLSWSATVEWDDSKQKFELVSIHDDCYCESCDGLVKDEIQEYEVDGDRLKKLLEWSVEIDVSLQDIENELHYYNIDMSVDEFLDLREEMKNA